MINSQRTYASKNQEDFLIMYEKFYNDKCESINERHSFLGKYFSSVQLSPMQPLSHVRLLRPPWTAACQASLSITNSQSLLKLKSIKSVMPSNHLILCHPLLLLPPIPPSIRVFSNESVLHIRGQSIGVSASVFSKNSQDDFL